VLSPSTRTFDVLRKRSDHARVGIPELWLVDPDPRSARVQVYRPPAEQAHSVEHELVDELSGDAVLTTPLLPGLRVVIVDLVLHRPT
jgi:Uma2 family endonuclease